jgi:hypothetical protein
LKAELETNKKFAIGIMQEVVSMLEEKNKQELLEEKDTSCSKGQIPFMKKSP